MKSHKALYISIVQLVLVLFSQNLLAAAATNVKCTGCVDTSDIANQAVTASKIKPAAVATSKIKNTAVTTSKIRSGAVTTSKIRDGAVTPEKLSAGAYGVTVRMSYSSYSLNYSSFSDTVIASCRSGETLIGATCDCHGNETYNVFTTNWGSVEDCGVAGNSVFGSCRTDNADFSLYGPAVTAFAFCSTSGTQVSAQTSSVQTGDAQESDGESILLSLEAQEIIDRRNSMKNYLEQQLRQRNEQ